MAISSNPVPFKNPEEEENSAVKNQTQSLLQKPVSPNVAIEKPETEAQKILKARKICFGCRYSQTRKNNCA
jgi:hypothetical protein